MIWTILWVIIWILGIYLPIPIFFNLVAAYYIIRDKNPLAQKDAALVAFGSWFWPIFLPILIYNWATQSQWKDKNDQK